MTNYNQVTSIEQVYGPLSPSYEPTLAELGRIDGQLRLGFPGLLGPKPADDLPETKLDELLQAKIDEAEKQLVRYRMIQLTRYHQKQLDSTHANFWQRVFWNLRQNSEDAQL